MSDKLRMVQVGLGGWGWSWMDVVAASPGWELAAVVDIDRKRDRIVFVGDSPNDAPMFGFFPNACGVANVLRFRDRLEAEPAYVTSQEGGYGFVEVADRILDARSRRDAA